MGWLLLSTWVLEAWSIYFIPFSSVCLHILKKHKSNFSSKITHWRDMEELMDVWQRWRIVFKTDELYLAISEGLNPEATEPFYRAPWGSESINCKAFFPYIHILALKSNLPGLGSVDCPLLVNFIVIWKQRNMVQRSSRYSFGFCDGSTGNLDLPAWPHIWGVIRFSEGKRSTIRNRKDVWLPEEKKWPLQGLSEYLMEDKNLCGIYAMSF